MFLKNNSDVASLVQCLEQFESIKSSSLSDFNNVQSSIRDYREKIGECKEKAEEAKSEVADDAELESLQKELEEEVVKERLLKEELRYVIYNYCFPIHGFHVNDIDLIFVFLMFINTVIYKEIGDLDRQRVSVEEGRKNLKKLEQDKMSEQSMLSMYASVTNIIPNLNNQCIVSGHLVDRDKKVVEKFDLNQTETTELDKCNNIWKMMNLR